MVGISRSSCGSCGSGGRSSSSSVSGSSSGSSVSGSSHRSSNSSSGGGSSSIGRRSYCYGSFGSFEETNIFKLLVQEYLLYIFVYSDCKISDREVHE